MTVFALQQKGLLLTTLKREENFTVRAGTLQHFFYFDVRPLAGHIAHVCVTVCIAHTILLEENLLLCEKAVFTPVSRLPCLFAQSNYK